MEMVKYLLFMIFTKTIFLSVDVYIVMIYWCNVTAYKNNFDCIVVPMDLGIFMIL